MRIEGGSRTEVSAPDLPSNQTMELPDDSGERLEPVELPDDSGGEFDAVELPDDSGEELDMVEFPDDSGGEFDTVELPDDSSGELDMVEIPDDSGEQHAEFQQEEQSPLSPQEIADKQNQEILAVQTGETLLDSDMKRGNFGEMVTDKTLRDLGYERISSDAVTSCADKGHHGIDGIYFKEDGHPQYVILDAKFGSAQLHMTTDGKQMSLPWIDARLDSSIGTEAADKLRMELLLNPENVGLYVCHVDGDGNTVFDKLDFDANIAERNVDLHDA